MRITFIAVLAGICGCSQRASSRDEVLLRCRQQAEACGAALVARDFEKLVDLTYPRLVELQGGRDKMARAARLQARKAGFEVISLKVEMPERIIIAGSDVLTVVPLTREVLDSGKTTAGRSFFLAVSSDQGKSWTFIDGTNLDNRMLKIVLPHFPAGIRIP